MCASIAWLLRLNSIYVEAKSNRVLYKKQSEDLAVLDYGDDDESRPLSLTLHHCIDESAKKNGLA